MRIWCGRCARTAAWPRNSPSQLSFYHTVAGSWRYVVEARDRIAAVTPADVQRVAAQYLTKSNRTVGVLVKKPSDKKVAAAGEVAR